MCLLALRSHNPHHEMLAAFMCFAVSSKGRTSEIHGMKRHCVMQEYPEFRFYINRRGVLRERLIFTMEEYREVECVRRWLTRHDQATDNDNLARIWHKITYTQDGLTIERNCAALGNTYVHNIAALIAKCLRLPNWEYYKNRSFRRIGIMRPINVHGSVTFVQF